MRIKVYPVCAEAAGKKRLVARIKLGPLLWIVICPFTCRLMKRQNAENRRGFAGLDGSGRIIGFWRMNEGAPSAKLADEAMTQLPSVNHHFSMVGVKCSGVAESQFDEQNTDSCGACWACGEIGKELAELPRPANRREKTVRNSLDGGSVFML